MTRLTLTLTATVLAAAALLIQAATAAADPPSGAVAIVPFAGDVFTVSTFGNLIPVNPITTPPSAPLFNLLGSPLNQTWGPYSSATATASVKSVTRDGVDYTDVKLDLSGLIANGVYSLFYETFSPDSANPVCGSTGEPLVALTARHPELQTPDSDSFVADGSGSAEFDASVPVRLLDAIEVNVVVIYHFDGNTYGPVPNFGEAVNNCHSSYGIDAMRQFLIILKSL